MSTPLLSAVLVLKYEKPFRSQEKYLGRAAHDIALGLMGHINSNLADELHDTNALMPITISDLFQSDSHHHWLRITALRPDVIEAVSAMANATGSTYDGWQLVHGLTSFHDWTGSTTAQRLIDTHWQATRHIKISFETPTAIKSLGLYRTMPDPLLIFKSLYERYNQLIAVTLPYTPPREILETFLTYAISLDYYRLRSVHIRMKQAAIPAFKGTVDYHLEKPTRALKRLIDRDPSAQPVLDHYDDLLALVNLLAQCGFYLGVGIKTAQGMGMMRVLS